ncbi:MAG: leucine-rich repeat protein [Prevotella sp.]|nr:leucine-rich repeat protein [Prevotella sp.]
MMMLGLCLLALLPLHAYADYGISGDNTWHQQYLAKTANGELAARGTLVENAFSGGGNKTNPYLISTVWDLCRLADIVNGGFEWENNQGTNNGYDLRGTYFKLANDLDLDGAVWYPIGVRENAWFAGCFDGDGHTITKMGMTIGDITELYGEKYCYGLFGFVKGVIHNLNMTDAQVTINQTESNCQSLFHIGLLCGSIGTDWSKLIASYPGAIWSCDIAGSITGMAESAFHYHSNNSIGGIVGKVEAPASIYQCHAKPYIDVKNCGFVGGIAGYIENGFITNDYDGNTNTSPKVSYLFDCTADVTMSLSSSDGNSVVCGGICGYNDGCNIVACASSGNIACTAPSSDGTLIGGIAGHNKQTIMDCVSLVSMRTSYTAGGIVGWNSFTYNSKQSSTIANCVYSGYIFSGKAYGIVGKIDESGYQPVNCLFLGTLRTNDGYATNAPLWPNDNDDAASYCDQNLYDDWNDRDVYLSFSELTCGENSKAQFNSDINIYLDWKARLYSTEHHFSYNGGSEWKYNEGFYPCLQVSSSNITNSSADNLSMRDEVIKRAVSIVHEDNNYDDKLSALQTPKLFPAYAWLASVPAGIHNGLVTHHLDAPLSLTPKTQDMETVGNVTTMKRATFSLPSDQNLLTVTNETATPKEDTQGGVVLTITSSDKISKQFFLMVNTIKQWDKKIAKTLDAGDGTKESPYIVHNARQLIKVFNSNKAGEYYKLKNDIWFNQNLITENGAISDTGVAWDEAKNASWNAYLDGDSHAIHGLYASPASSLLGTIGNNASIENVAFTSCAVRTLYKIDELGGFLAWSIGDDAVIRNCLFDGLYQLDEGYVRMGSLAEECGNATVEDCVVSVYTIGSPAIFGLFTAESTNPTFKHVLMLNNSQAIHSIYLHESDYKDMDCYTPAGYMSYDKCAKPVAEMTDGTFFTGDGYEKWTSQKGRFPMLKSFAGTAFGRLISLPIYTTSENGLNNMSQIFDFVPSRATWTTTTSDVAVDLDIRVLEPKTASKSLLLVRSMDGARMVTPLTTAESIKTGIVFTDEEAKNFCVAHYDNDGDGEVSLSELKGVSLDVFQADMNKNDSNPNDNDGDLISAFPEFHYFAGISDLGTSFQDKEKLRTLDFSNKITELSDDDFKGNSSMESFTIPVSVGTVSGQAFYNSGLENYYVETDHQKFTATDGVLYNMSQETLLSYPNGRKNTSIEITDNVKTIGSKAVYKMAEVDTVIINAADYDYETVVELEENAFTAADGKQLLFLIEDGTQDLSDDELEARAYSARRAGTVDHRGKGTLLSKYLASEYWTGKELESFIYLDIDEKSKDSEGNYWATLYCGFDTELPDYMTPYIVDKENTSETSATLVLRRISNKVRMLTPVVIKSTKPVTKHILSPSKSSTVFTSIPMYENLLDGIDRNGMQVYQSDANDGGCLTLGRNSKGEIGFFIYKGKDKIPPYRAYISVNKVSYARELTFTIGDDYSTDIRSVQRKAAEDDAYYNLNGQRTEHPDKGIYIYKGKKVIK